MGEGEKEGEGKRGEGEREREGKKGRIRVSHKEC